MNVRRKKQGLYGTLYGIIWVAIFLGIYALIPKPAPAPVCPPAGCVPSDLPKISLVESQFTENPAFFLSSDGHYTVLTQVKNTNIGFAAQDFNYEINFYDAAGNVIAAVPGSSFMYGGEVKYLLLPNFAINAPVDHIGFALRDAEWVPADAMGIVPQFTLQSLGLLQAPSGTIAVSGEITNNDVAAFTNVLIIGVFKKTGGAMGGASQTLIDTLAPGEKKNFSVMYPAAPDIDPALTQFYAYAFRVL